MAIDPETAREERRIATAAAQSTAETAATSPSTASSGEGFNTIPYKNLSADIKNVLEANGASRGMTGKQYYDLRGGVNLQGFYGDSYTPGVSLTDKEYLAVLADVRKRKLTGTAIGAAINMATEAKRIQALLSDPSKIKDQFVRSAYESGTLDRTQLEKVLRAGYGSGGDNRRDVLSAINTASQGGNLPLAPVGVLPNGDKFYGYDQKGQPITNPNTFISGQASTQSINDGAYQGAGASLRSTSGSDSFFDYTAPGGSDLTSSYNTQNNAGTSSLRTSTSQTGNVMGTATFRNPAADTYSFGMGGVGRGEYAPSAPSYNIPTNTVPPQQPAQPPQQPNGPGTPGYEERKSAYDLLYTQFAQYGLGGLVEPLKKLILQGVSPSEFVIRLRETDAYKKRFAANAQRVAKGLRALSEAEYIDLEDQYQNVMRQYGLPASYYARGDMGRQPGFEKFIAGDVSAAELEDRVQTAQNRVINANPEVAQTLKQFYPGITNGDILAYALDPEQALTNIKRKVTAAEIGAGATMAGLATDVARAEELQRYGVTGEQARASYQAIGGFLPRAQQLSEFYAGQNVGPYTQTTAEQELFNLPSAADAATRRRKLGELESAAFSGSAGTTGGALARERAGSF